MVKGFSVWIKVTETYLATNQIRHFEQVRWFVRDIVRRVLMFRSLPQIRLSGVAPASLRMFYRQIDQYGSESTYLIRYVVYRYIITYLPTKE